jgi:hypothetical protein
LYFFFFKLCKITLNILRIIIFENIKFLQFITKLLVFKKHLYLSNAYFNVMLAPRAPVGHLLPQQPSRPTALATAKPQPKKPITPSKQLQKTIGELL